MDSMTAHNAPPSFRLPNRASRLKPYNTAKYFKVNSTRDYGDENLFRERIMYRKTLKGSQTRTLNWKKISRTRLSSNKNLNFIPGFQTDMSNGLTGDLHLLNACYIRVPSLNN